MRVSVYLAVFFGLMFSKTYATRAFTGMFDAACLHQDIKARTCSGFFFGPQGQCWRGFAGGVNFSGRWMKSIFPRSPPGSLTYLRLCTAPPPVNEAKAKLIAKLFAVPVRAISDHLKSIFAHGEFSEEPAIRKYLRAVLLVLVRGADRARISAPTHWPTNSTRRRKPESAGREPYRRSRRRSNRRASA